MQSASDETLAARTTGAKRQLHATRQQRASARKHATEVVLEGRGWRGDADSAHEAGGATALLSRGALAELLHCARVSSLPSATGHESEPSEKMLSRASLCPSFWLPHLRPGCALSKTLETFQMPRLLAASCRVPQLLPLYAPSAPQNISLTVDASPQASCCTVPFCCQRQSHRTRCSE